MTPTLPVGTGNTGDTVTCDTPLPRSPIRAGLWWAGSVLGDVTHRHTQGV